MPHPPRAARPWAAWRSGVANPGHPATLPHVSYVILGIIALLAALAQFSVLSGWRAAPDLPLALAAWAMVDGTARGVIWRAWLVGGITDLVDPTPDIFASIAYVLLALAYLPIRNLVFRTRVAGWGVWAAIASLLVQGTDRWLHGAGDSVWQTQCTTTGLTALAAMGIGWLFGGLPGGLRPVAREGA